MIRGTHKRRKALFCFLGEVLVFFKNGRRFLPRITWQNCAGRQASFESQTTFPRTIIACRRSLASSSLISLGILGFSFTCTYLRSHRGLRV